MSSYVGPDYWKLPPEGQLGGGAGGSYSHFDCVVFSTVPTSLPMDLWSFYKKLYLSLSLPLMHPACCNLQTSDISL